MTLPGRPAGLGESHLSWEALSTRCANLGGSFHATFCGLSPCWTDFRCLASHWPGVSTAGFAHPACYGGAERCSAKPRLRPRRATFFLVVRQKRRQRNVPRCRAPFGGSLLPAMPGGVFANSPFGLKHAKPFFRPSSPPVGTSEGTGNAGDQRSVALSTSGEARCSSESPSEPPSSGATGGEVRRSCLSPQGEFCAGRPV